MKLLSISLTMSLSFGGFLFSQDDTTYTTAQIKPSDNNVIVILEDGVLSWVNSNSPKTDHPFTTDGCSMFPDGSWVHCCTIHDKAYWVGGSNSDRIEADFELKKCVSNTGPEARWEALGWTMYVGVRFGGVGWIPTPFRWGYGWKFPRTGP